VNMPIVPGGDVPYSDTPEPKIYGYASPLDPQLFSTIANHAGDLLARRIDGKYSPAEVAQQVDDLAAAAVAALPTAEDNHDADLRRLAEDVRIVSGIGHFYAAKIRAALLFEVWQQTGDPRAGALAVEQYEKGMAGWSAMAERVKTVYVSDISYGRIHKRRGHWADRIPEIENDIAAMKGAVAAGGAKAGDAGPAIAAILKPARRPSSGFAHDVPDSFHPGAPLPLMLAVKAGTRPDRARLFYRHVNQAERWAVSEMTLKGAEFHAPIPASYTGSPFPLQYYFELTGGDQAWLYPGFNRDFSNQPYYAVWKRTA